MIGGERTIFKKMIFSGNNIELLSFEGGIRVGHSFPRRKQKRRKKNSQPKQLAIFDGHHYKLINHEATEEELKPRLSSYIRTKNNIKRLAWCNSNEFLSFLTLTFEENISNFDKANYELKNFLKKIRRRYPDIKYLGVCEFQKRGAIHYHFLLNTFHDANDLAKIWKNGFIKINKLRNKNNLGSYITKYLTKENFLDNRFFNKRKFFCSRNLKRSIVINDTYVIHDILRGKYSDYISLSPKYTWSGINEYIGNISYTLFDVKYSQEKISNIDF